jgi:arsenate reductase
VSIILAEAKLQKHWESTWHQRFLNLFRPEQKQNPKLISDIPTPDIAISTGCNVGCPFIGRAFDDNWGLEDPTGKSDEEFKIIIKEIENKILALKGNVHYPQR